ncbi:MAG: DUF6920 family protein [Candidatus Oleimicrobiaceae bacterium]
MWWKVIAGVFAVLACVVAVAVLYGRHRWQVETGVLHAKMEAARVPITPKSYAADELAGLPAPVQRYFRAAIKEGQPLIAAVRVHQTGSFNISEAAEQWKPFSSTQRVVTQRPGFLWDARIRMAPAMTIRVRDAYVAGEGVLTARVWGLVPVMQQPSTPELAQGELLRFLAEGAWYPPALLPSQGVVWEAIDDTQARATLSDGTTRATLVFQFDAQGLINSVFAEGRYRQVRGVPAATPWRGRFWDYAPRHGMLVPSEGEVAWLLADGWKPYWRGRIEHIEYEYAR